MPTVLIMDDDESVLLLMRETLESAGYTVYTAENAIKGAEIYTTQKIDLIFTDILMPEKDGVEAVLDIRKMEKPRPTIIAMSGEGAEFLPVIQDLGVKKTLLKPLTRDKILQTLSDLTP